MAGSITFSLNVDVLKWARSTMGYTIDQAAKKAGISAERYTSWENGESKPTYKQLETLAETVYKRPLAILLMTSPPKEATIQSEFRNLTNSEISTFSPELRFSLRRAKRYQLILEEISSPDEELKYKRFKIQTINKPDKVASAFRDFVALDLSTQKNWKIDDSMSNFQKLIEEIGIFIFKMKMPMDEARAFCLTGIFPIIVLNTEDSKNGRIFSLFHEVCHILLNTNDVFRDNLNTKNKEYAFIEEFCNQFAASFLVPDEEFAKDLYNFSENIESIDSIIQRLSNSYKVSNEVIARKLLRLNKISETTFWNKKKMWDSYAKAAKEKDKSKNIEAGINQGIKIIYEKGRPYVSKILSAYQNGSLSTSDLTNYLETKLSNVPKVVERLNK